MVTEFDDEPTVFDADPMSPAPLLLPAGELTWVGVLRPLHRLRAPADRRPCAELWLFIDGRLELDAAELFATHALGCVSCRIAIREAGKRAALSHGRSARAADAK